MQDSGSGGGTMTLAFELEALRALADPQTVFQNAREWSEYVGVVSDEPTYVVTNFTRKRRIRQDFFSGPKGKAESLESVRRQFDTDRHVFIGVSQEDQSIADAQEWEYLPVQDAAEAAGWALAEAEDEQAEPVADTSPDDWP